MPLIVHRVLLYYFLYDRGSSYPFSLSKFEDPVDYTFGHEIGHTLGANHNPEADKPSGVPDPPYAAGYHIPGTNKITKMR